MLSPGQVVGDIRIESPVGRELDESVWLGRHVRSGSTALVEVLEFSSSEETESAERDAALYLDIRAESLPMLLDAIRLGKTALALVWEDWQGPSLRDVVKARGALEPAVLRRVGLALTNALSELHERGLVHGGMRPESVVFPVAVSGPKLRWRTAAAEHTRRFGTANIISTDTVRPFIAPEMAVNALPTPQADVFGLGATLWYAATGVEVPQPSGTVGSRIPELASALLVALVQTMAIDPEYRSTSRQLEGVFDAWDAATVVVQVSAPPPAQPLETQHPKWGTPTVVAPPPDIGGVEAGAPPPPQPTRVAPPASSPFQDTGRDAPVTACPPAVPFASKPRTERVPGHSGTADNSGPPLATPTANVPVVDERNVFDENVQFTVYRPKRVVAGRWYAMLAFAHLAERRPDASPEEPDPIEEVGRQAERIFGDDLPAQQKTSAIDSSHAVPRDGEITFVPAADGIQFNPPSRSFRWVETVHREEFRLRATSTQLGALRGRLTFYLGNIIVAEIPLVFQLVGEEPREQARPEPAMARPFRNIFASYSHYDLGIVEQVERFARLTGDRFVRDWVDLRAGEKWNERLPEFIREADVFQLFWSRNSMRSPFVEQEWRYALSLDRPQFVRPVYWENPLPCLPERDLPPDDLRRLHFERLELGCSPTHVAWGGLGRVEIPPPEHMHVSASVPEVMPKSTPPMSGSRTRWLLRLLALVLLVAASILIRECTQLARSAPTGLMTTDPIKLNSDSSLRSRPLYTLLAIADVGDGCVDVSITVAR